MLRTYYRLTKPGIVYGNALPAIGGFFLGAQNHPVLSIFLGMLFGISFVMAGACVFNNYIDRNIDAKMARTKRRALVIGTVTPARALIFAAALSGLGLALLYNYTNTLTVLLAAFGLFAYVVLYGIGKRYTAYGTIIGSISGAVPPVVGYCSATGVFDQTAILLFLILVFWQMPHFYAIGLYRLKDYTAAGLPVWPVKRGIQNTKHQIVIFIAGFSALIVALFLEGSVGYVYLVTMGAICALWLGVAIRGLTTTHSDDQWAKSIFKLSLLALTAFSALLSFGAFLP